MTDTSLQSISTFEHFLNRLSEADLRLLNRMVVERLKLYHKARELHVLANFNLLDRVYFQHEGKNVFGTITKLNRRSATIADDDGRRWNVAPGFLNKVV